MIIQLSDGHHLYCRIERCGFLWRHRRRLWSLYRAQITDDLLPDFVTVFENLDDDSMHLHLIGIGRPASDMALFVEALGDRPFREQAPITKLKRIKSEAQAAARRIA